MYYLILLLLLILKDVFSGLFPDPEISEIPIVLQYGLAYGAGFLMASYFPFYFYKAFGLRRLRWHALYGVLLLVLAPFILIFGLEYYFTKDIESAINHSLVIPSVYGLVLLIAILRSIREKYSEQIERKQFFEVIAVYIAVIPWASLAFFAYFRIDQVHEVLLTNVGFIVITVLFIRKSIIESREEYNRLEQLTTKNDSVAEHRSKLELIDATIERLRKTTSKNPQSNFEANLNLSGLTTREKEIVRLIRKGRSYKSIGEELFISERTVTKHVQNIFSKLEVSNKIELLNRLE